MPPRGRGVFRNCRARQLLCPSVPCFAKTPNECSKSEEEGANGAWLNALPAEHCVEHASFLFGFLKPPKSAALGSCGEQNNGGDWLQVYYQLKSFECILGKYLTVARHSDLQRMVETVLDMSTHSPLDQRLPAWLKWCSAF